MEHNTNAIIETTGAVAVHSREQAEIQAAIVAANMRPRDLDSVLAKIEKACSYTDLAEMAEYAFPRGGSTVNGPAIPLVEQVAQAWGNVRTGWQVIEVKPQAVDRPLKSGDAAASVIEAFAWDLETNYRFSARAEVPHWRDTKNGGYSLTDARDIREAVANIASRVVRGCMERVIPRWVTKRAVDQCRATLIEDARKQDEARDPKLKQRQTVQRIVSGFAPFGVDVEDLCSFCKVATVNEITPEHVADLRSVYNALKDGSDKGDFFPKHATSKVVQSDDPMDDAAAPAPGKVDTSDFSDDELGGA